MCLIYSTVCFCSSVRAKCCEYVALFFPSFSLQVFLLSLQTFNIIPPPSHTHIHIYIHTYLQTARSRRPKIRRSLCSDQTALPRIRTRRSSCFAGQTAHLKNVCDRHMYRRTHAKNHTWPLLLNSQSSSHTHSSSRAASLLTPFHLAHTPAGGFS